VIAFIALKFVAPDLASLTGIAGTLHCRISSIYNAIARIFTRFGITIMEPLSRVNIVEHFQKISTSDKNHDIFKSDIIDDG
nr:hypothetical protein [Candidatus Sigynarchaeota archaeon]